MKPQPALVDEFPSVQPGEEIVVFAGKAILTAQKEVSGDLAIVYGWYPRPQVRARFTQEPDSGGFYAPLGKATITPAGKPPFTCSIFRVADSIDGFVDGGFWGADTDVNKLYFYIPNFWKFDGEVVNSSAGAAARGRCVLESSEWRVTLDPLLNEKPHEFLNTAHGNAITHIGMAERVDGSSIRQAQARKFQEELFWYLSFCRGRWTGTVLLTGQSESGRSEWISLHSTKISSWAHVDSWCRYRADRTIRDAYKGCSELLNSESLREAVLLGIHWYVEANMCAGGIEGSLVLAQATLEMLAWHWIVQENGFCSDNGFKPLPAEDKIRWLLSDCGIPTAIPTTLERLTERAKELNWASGPTAITQIRNGLAHGSPKQLTSEFSRPHDSRREAWSLALWYVELVLLKLMGFRNEYYNRIDPPKQSWDRGDVVPWLNTKPTR